MLLYLVDFSVMVLSSVAWPFTQGPPFTVPGDVCFAFTHLNRTSHIIESNIQFEAGKNEIMHYALVAINHECLCLGEVPC